MRENIRGHAGIVAEVVELELVIRAFAGGLDDVVRGDGAVLRDIDA